MHTIQTQVTVNQDHVLNLTLPEDITEGTYQVVIVMNLISDKKNISNQKKMNKIIKFAGFWEDLSAKAIIIYANYILILNVRWAMPTLPNDDFINC